jgi:capsule polysaccharide export protein KpsE/RkpR
VIAAILTFLLSFALPKRWTAEAGFIPESSTSIQLPSGISALAGELGFSIPTGDPTSSPDFYTAVTQSRSLLERTMLTRFAVPHAGPADSAALIDILDIEDDTPRERMESGVEWMQDHTSADVDAKTGIISIKAELPDPELAAAVVSRMVGLLNEFNQRTRNLRARERRKFSEDRAADAQRDLDNAENALRIFLSRNRQIENSPELQFERGRLDRQVQLRTDVYQTLRREYEVARIDEINDTPVLTVVDAPVAPARPSSPRRVRMAAVAAVLGGLVGVSLAFFREYLNRSRELHPLAFDRLVRVWRRRPAA